MEDHKHGFILEEVDSHPIWIIHRKKLILCCFHYPVLKVQIEWFLISKTEQILRDREGWTREIISFDGTVPGEIPFQVCHSVTPSLDRLSVTPWFRTVVGPLSNLRLENGQLGILLTSESPVELLLEDSLRLNVLRRSHTDSRRRYLWHFIIYKNRNRRFKLSLNNTSVSIDCIWRKHLQRTVFIFFPSPLVDPHPVILSELVDVNGHERSEVLVIFYSTDKGNYYLLFVLFLNLLLQTRVFKNFRPWHRITLG